jgi:hypothetical protein
MKRNKNMKISNNRNGIEASRIEIKITEITRNGGATVKLFSKDLNRDNLEILKLISNKTMEISVHSEEISQYFVSY